IMGGPITRRHPITRQATTHRLILTGRVKPVHPSPEAAAHRSGRSAVISNASATAQTSVRRNDDGGRPYVARHASLKRRILRNPAAKAISDRGIAVWSINRFAACTRRVAATSLGVAPAW